MREVGLWGEHLDEYQLMFGLEKSDLDLQLLEYGSGATAVNAQLNTLNKSMTSCDPLFSLPETELEQTVLQIFDQAIKNTLEASSHYDFSVYGGIDGLIKKRREGVMQFLTDYSQGSQEKRYLPVTPSLPFEDFTFDIAVSSSYLFSGAENQDFDFHMNTIRELARVAKEVRIFPLVDREGHPSPLLGPILLNLQQNNYAVEIREVDYLLQLGGHAMLKVWARECQV